MEANASKIKKKNVGTKSNESANCTAGICGWKVNDCADQHFVSFPKTQDFFLYYWWIFRFFDVAQNKIIYHFCPIWRHCHNLSDYLCRQIYFLKKLVNFFDAERTIRRTSNSTNNLDKNPIQYLTILSISCIFHQIFVQIFARLMMPQ